MAYCRQKRAITSGTKGRLPTSGRLSAVVSSAPHRRIVVCTGQECQTPAGVCTSWVTSSFPPVTKRVSMYDKWMSKGAMFRKDQSKASTTSGACLLPGQQMNRAKDTEDRDLMQQVVNIVQDCNKEVKSTLTAVKEKLDSQTEFSGEKLTDTMKAFLEDVWRHEERMLQAIEEGRQSKDKLQEAERQLAVKEAVIKQLQGQLEDADRPRDMKQVAQAVRQEMLSPQLTVENKLMEILEVTREASEQHSEQLNRYHSQMTAQAKDCKEWKTATQKLLRDTEKRLQKDLGGLRKEVQRGEKEWRCGLQDQLSEACSIHTHDLERLLERALADCTSTLTSSGSNEGTAAVAAAAVKKDLQALLQKQTKTTEKNLQAMWQQQAQKQQQQLRSLHQSLLSVITEGMQSITKQFQERQCVGDTDAPTLLTMPEFEEKIEEYHTDIKKQLEEMHRNHVEEVRRLQKDTQLSNRALPPTTADHHRPFTRTMTMLAPSAQASCLPTTATAKGYPLLQGRKGMGKISPLSKLDRASLFSKPKPSPMVAVLPQQQQSSQAVSMSTKNKRPTDSDSEVTLHQPAPSTDLGITKKRKGGKGRKRCGAKKRKNTQRDVRTVQSPKSCSQSGKALTAEQFTVYDFCDEQSPDHGRQLFQSFQLQNKENRRNELLSPSASTESCLSSPAVSVTVDTELVWVRRSRWQTYTTPRRISSAGAADQRGMDMLSSPSMAGTAARTALQQLQEERDCTDLPRTRSGVKRKL